MRNLCYWCVIAIIVSSCNKSSLSIIEKDPLQKIEKVRGKHSIQFLFSLSSFDGASFTSSSQGMDIYENRLLFQAGLSGNIVYVLDLDSYSCLGSFSFTTPNNEPSHMNNINCGVVFCSTDVYPLLYVSQTSHSHSCYVVRLSNDLATYELVQTITYRGTQHHANSNYDWFLDLNNDYIYTYGKHDGILEDREIVCFPLPSLDDKDIVYTDDDVIDSFVLDNMSIYQGSRIIEGLLYAPVGYGNVQYPGRLKIIDLKKKSVIDSIALSCGEPESIGRYKGGAIICGGGKKPNYYYIEL